MLALRRLNISHRLWLLILLAILGIAAITGLSLVQYHTGLMLEKEIQTRKLVETGYSIIADYHARTEKGEFDTNTGQKQAMKAIKALRYDETNYFWINDYDARMVMHPIKPELDGKDLSNFEDPAGLKLFSEFARKVKADGEGIVPYLWPKPGKEKPQAKVSYVKGFQPWGWIIGSGIYVDDVEAAFWKSAASQGVISLVGLILLLAASFMIAKSIVSPLNKTTAALNDIAKGEGDLTQRLDTSGTDEVAKLSLAFNEFSEKIQRTIIQVSQASTQLAAAAVELSTTTTQSNNNMSLQRNETQQVATAVTEMAATVQEIAQSAEGAADSARMADEEAAGGKRVVVEATDAIKQLAEEMQTASTVIDRLARESDEIGSVLDVIRGIAEQTNLLALNAAIEAARAGEQGRGFAVVADEVRTLASRTQESTQEIQGMIERLQAGTQDAVKVMQRSSSNTVSTVEKAQAAAQSLDNIVSSVALISDRNTQIASASEEQSAVAHEIDHSVVQISQLAEQAAIASQQVSESSSELSRLGDELQMLISQFKVA
jgi:methyl-accepting chemotaxis protein